MKTMPFILEHEVQLNRGRRVKLLGIRHGGFGVVVGPMTGRKIKEHAQSADQVMAEEKSRYFLPTKKLVREAQNIDHGGLKRLLLKSLDALEPKGRKERRVNDEIRKNQHLAVYTREKRGLPIEVSQRHQNMKLRDRRETERYLRQEFKGLAEGEVKKIASTMITIRSYFMAKNIMKKTEEGKTALAVVGVGHHALVRKFLENPRLMAKYGAFVERNWGKICRLPGKQLELSL